MSEWHSNDLVLKNIKFTKKKEVMVPIKWRQWAMNVVLGHTKTVSRCHCCVFKYCDNNYSIHSSYHTLIIVIRLLYGTIWHRFDDKLVKGELLWKAQYRINMQQHMYPLLSEIQKWTINRIFHWYYKYGK